MNTKKAGQIGEKLAQNYLVSKGYKILKVNWYCNHGEIDIVTKKEKKLIFVEVKYRKNLKYGTETDAFDFKKRKHLRRSVGFFLAKYGLLRVDYQIDLLCLSDAKIIHYKNVLL